MDAVNLTIQLDRALRVVLGTGMKRLEHVPRRISIGFTLAESKPPDETLKQGRHASYFVLTHHCENDI